MADLKELAEKRSALLWFDPNKIEEKPGLNARDMESAQTQEHIEELCISIMERGFLAATPLQIFQDGSGIFVAAGHCRLRAVKLAISRGAEILSIPCLVEGKETTRNELSRQLDQIADNNGGLELNAIEAGAAIKKALSNGWSTAKVAAYVGKSISWVNQTLEFQAAPAEVHEVVRSGEMSATLAAQQVREHGPEEGTRIVKEAVRTAKAKGKKKATAKHLPSRAPKKAEPTGDDSQIKITGGVAGMTVQFGSRSPLGPFAKSAWRSIANQILWAAE